MNLLGAKLYDPTTAVTKNTTAALAMTALDTTNLRIAFTIPSHGMVRVRLMGVIHGATTFPSILLGVMNGSTVVGRVAPVQSLGNTAVATALVNVEADFIVTGLTPGAVNWDAAYGVETLVAATGIKYGGPNDTTANNAFGGFAFEVWDPKPNGDILTSIADTRMANLDAAVSSRMASYTQPSGFLAATFPGGTIASTTNISAGTIGTAINLTNAPTSGDFTAAMKTSLNAATPSVTVNDKTGFSLAVAPLDAAGTRSAIGLATANLDTQLAALDTDILSRLATASYTAPLSASGVRTAVGLASANLDTQLSNINNKTTNLPTSPAAVSDVDAISTLLTGAQVEPGQGIPAANASVLNKIAYLYKAWRNKKTQTATTGSLYNDDDTTVAQKFTIADDGTTFTSGKVNSGP